MRFLLLLLLFSGCSLFEINNIKGTTWSGWTDYEIPDMDGWTYFVSVDFFGEDKVSFDEYASHPEFGTTQTITRVYSYNYKLSEIYGHWGNSRLGYSANGDGLYFNSVYAIPLKR